MDTLCNFELSIDWIKRNSFYDFSSSARPPPNLGITEFWSAANLTSWISNLTLTWAYFTWSIDFGRYRVKWMIFSLKRKKLKINIRDGPEMVPMVFQDPNMDLVDSPLPQSTVGRWDFAFFWKIKNKLLFTFLMVSCGLLWHVVLKKSKKREKKPDFRNILQL